MDRQNNNIDNGLYLENLDVVVPWKTSIDNITKYGRPEIIAHSEQRTDALWRNVSLFGGLTLDLTAMFWQTLFGRSKFNNAHAYIDRQTFDKFKPHLDNYFKQESLLIKQNELEYYFKWTVEKCKIKLGQGDRFGTYYYINIEKKNWL
jgi:hypothetical protein